MAPATANDGAALALERRRADDPDAARLIAAYLAELVAALPAFDAARSTSAGADEMAPPRGAFLVAYDGGVAIACGGVKRTDLPPARAGDAVAEIKRMYVDPGARGRGVARRLLAALEDEARALGCGEVVLDTAAPLAPAIALYLAAGYREVAAYNANPFAARWFRKAL